MTRAASADLIFLDTSVWIEALRPKGSPKARRLAHDAIDAGLVITNGVVRVELLSGARDRAMFERLASLLGAVVTVETKSETWALASDLGFTLRRAGDTVPATDLVIAASALEHGALLVHLDRHFETIASASPLRERHVG